MERSGGSREEDSVVVEAHDLVYRYGERADPALRGCDLTVRGGDRILLEGPSGGGKSTLASLLVGLRVPQSGLLLLQGLDRHSLGDEGWRRRAVAAPQFQENHVLVDTFAFNLLMGRSWPPQAADLEEAEQVCRELGLGPLLDRMPAGLLQNGGSPAGSSLTARRAASTSPAPSFSGPSWWCSTKASPPSTRRISGRPWAACSRGPAR